MVQLIAIIVKEITQRHKYRWHVTTEKYQGSGFPVARWPEASQKAAGPAKAVLWLARLASHNFVYNDNDNDNSFIKLC